MHGNEILRNFSARKTIFLPIGTFCAVLLLAGCSSYQKDSQALRHAWENGNFPEAEKIAVANANDSSTRDRLVWQFDAATALRAEQKNAEAQTMFDNAAGTVAEWDKKADTLISDEFLASITNLSALPYRGKSYEKIMLQTYRALNFLEAGKTADARVALNAAFQAQAAAVAQNAKEIEAINAEAKKNSANLSSLKKNEKIQAFIKNKNADLSGVATYKNYVNPFTTWLHGIYFLHAGLDGGDRERARKSLERVAEMLPQNTFIAPDIALCKKNVPEAEAAGTPLTYVIFEYGLVPARVEERIDTALPIPAGRAGGIAFVPISIALPKLVLHNPSKNIPRQTAGTLDAQLICDMNAVVKTDFDNEFDSILARTLITSFSKAVASAAANVAAQSLAGRKDNGAGAPIALATLIGTSIYTYTSSGADIRSWQTLPQNYAIARLQTPASRQLEISVGGRAQTIQLISGTINLVFVKSTNLAGTPKIFQSTLR